MTTGIPPGRREQARDFLTSRRARLGPERAGLGTPRGHRRVVGLRRGEVADLAGVSVEHCSRLERGDLSGASPQVLDAIAGALQTDGAEHSHLLDLAVDAESGLTLAAHTAAPGSPAADGLALPASWATGPDSPDHLVSHPGDAATVQEPTAGGTP